MCKMWRIFRKTRKRRREMSMNERHEHILRVLQERTYITVEELSQLLFISPSSIRRDLTRMENSGLVVRSHGGVSLPAPISGVASFHERMHKNSKEKRLIAQKAASLLCEGQNVLLDSSSTAAFLLPHIARFKSVSVITNHLSTALHAIELGICTHCLGGQAMGNSGVLTGTQTYRALSDMHADLLFFSSQSLDENGDISDSTEAENFARICMLDSAKTRVFLCDGDKFGMRTMHRLTNLDQVEVAVFDRPYEPLRTSCRIL